MKLKAMFTTAFLAIVLGLVVLGSCAVPELGRGADGRLTPCPSSPNCVCSESGRDEDSFISPFEIPSGVPAGDAFEALAAVVGDRSRVTEREEGYLRSVFTTPLLRFKDDFEARLDAGAGVIHVRSSSRLGYSDLGANAKRIEALRVAWASALAGRRDG